LIYLSWKTLGRGRNAKSPLHHYTPRSILQAHHTVYSLPRSADPRLEFGNKLISQIELKLAKSDGINWPTFLSTGETQRAGPSSQPIQHSASEVPVDKPKPKRKNWDTVVDEEEEESKDPVSQVPVYHSFIPISCLSVAHLMQNISVGQLTIRMQEEKQPSRNYSQRYTKMQVTIHAGQ
jgi:hypothetical protein